MKASAILFCPTEALHHLPPAEIDVIRRFLFDHIRGIDRKHDKRWRRLWGRVWKAEAGECFQVYNAESRGGPFHRLHRAVLTRLFESQERYTDEDALHDLLKLRCWFVTWEEGPRGNPIPKPRSTNFDDCSEDDLREFHRKVEALLRDPHFTRRFWPHLNVRQRQEMVDTILANPKDEARP